MQHLKSGYTNFYCQQTKSEITILVILNNLTKNNIY